MIQNIYLNIEVDQNLSAKREETFFRIVDKNGHKVMSGFKSPSEARTWLATYSSKLPKV